MKRLSIRLALAAAVAVIATIPLVHGQGANALRVNVPFDFLVDSRPCPAGVYNFTQSQGKVFMTNADGKLSLWLKVITELARSSDLDDHLLAFDKANDKRVLSEVWLPGRDGALVYIMPGEHTHEIVRLTSKPRGTR
jgi:hypothetical protein